MATVKRFEELLAWKKSRELVREVYTTFKGCNDRGFTDQIQRAAVSVMNNIAEGFERGTRQELINYFYIAKGSAGEVRSMLYAALDIGYIDIETCKHIKGLAEECSKLIESFVQKVKTGSRRGLQHKHIAKKNSLEDEIKALLDPEIKQLHYPDD